ncbi:post-segregation antitoxin (ccd killing protein) [Nocardia neocaledoniensis]|uniref:Post-segregation antitoxin (Ccd killing protein) n=1 Tax=Nocardia neocaledoniensis TaxID=236511 RepID=A0A317NBK9_9NOCA|nr:post-segregation antitoxin (ccd killing protein) [Nocardia neocaledoniensis]
MYVPDDLAERARAAGVNVSALTQAAIVAALEKNATSAWLADIAERPEVPHDRVLAALDAARDEFDQ